MEIGEIVDEDNKYCRDCNLPLINLLEIERGTCKVCETRKKQVKAVISSAPIRTNIDCNPPKDSNDE